eukprot:2973629-Ditylum_brightwellii.AAC.1
MHSLLQQPSHDTNANEDAQPLSQSVDEPVALAPVLSPSQIPAVNKGENVNPEGEEIDNSIPEQDIQMPKMIDLSST